MAWDITVPADSDFISLGDDVIRQLKTDIQTALRGNATDGDEAKFPGSDAANPVFRYRGLKGNTGARPTAGQYGLYINTTLNTLQRDNGSSWEDVATLIPSGTKMPFYQASPPTGWTAVAVNDKFIRVVTSGGTGGTTGGTMDASTSLTHSHTLAHTHDLANHTHSTPNHLHAIATTPSSDIFETPNAAVANSKVYAVRNSSDASNPIQVLTVDTGETGNGEVLLGVTNTDGAGTSGTPSSNTSGAASNETTSGYFAGGFAYADFCVGTKD